jgi:hypothetical protein
MEPLMKNMDNCDEHYRKNNENLGEIDENH